MKITHILLLQVLILLIISSCNKEEIEEITTPFFAGVYNDSMLFHEFNPPLEIILQTDSLNNVKYGIDSLDIDLNGSFDVFISQKINTKFSDSLSYIPIEYADKNNFPFIGLRLKNDFEVAYAKVPVNAGLGTMTSINLIDTLLYETRIDKINNWHDSKMDKDSYMGFYNGSIWLWAAPPTSFWTYGPWFKLINRDMFIGIRKNTETGYKLGWIKVKIYSRSTFEIISYAIEK